MNKEKITLSLLNLKDSEDKNKWVIDDAAAPIVRRILRMTLEGYVHITLRHSYQMNISPYLPTAKHS